MGAAAARDELHGSRQLAPRAAPHVHALVQAAVEEADPDVAAQQGELLAQRQGQLAALNMLGFDERYGAGWDSVEVDGSVEGGDCLVRYRRRGRVLAVASIGRDAKILRCEAAMKRESEREPTGCVTA